MQETVSVHSGYRYMDIAAILTFLFDLWQLFSKLQDSFPVLASSEKK